MTNHSTSEIANYSMAMNISRRNDFQEYTCQFSVQPSPSWLRLIDTSSFLYDRSVPKFVTSCSIVFDVQCQYLIFNSYTAVDRLKHVHSLSYNSL